MKVKTSLFHHVAIEYPLDAPVPVRCVLWATILFYARARARNEDQLAQVVTLATRRGISLIPADLLICSKE